MTFDDVRAIALELPGVVESTSWGTPAVKLGKKLVARVREPGVLVVIIDLADKEFLIETQPTVYFTLPHYDGYPAVLVHLDKIKRAELARLLAASTRFVAGSDVSAGRSRASRHQEGEGRRSVPSAARRSRPRS